MVRIFNLIRKYFFISAVFIPQYGVFSEHTKPAWQRPPLYAH